MSLKIYRNILFAVSLAILAAIVLLSNPAQIYSELIKSRFELVILGLLITTFTALLRVFKWALLLKTRFLSLIPVQFLGITVSMLTPGRVAEPTKAVLLKIMDGTPVSKSLPSIIWERVLDIAAIIIFAFFSLTILAQTQFSLLGYIGVVVFSVLVIVFLLILYSKSFGMTIFNKIIIKLPLLKNLNQEFIRSFYAVRIGRERITFGFVIALFIWLLDGLVLYLVLLAFNAEINPLAAVGIVSLSVMIGVASSLPGGLGSTEIVMILLLNSIGVQNPIAVTAVLIYRFITIWYGLTLGFASFLYLSRKINLHELNLNSGLKI